jgi:predicted metalloendopeptidase
MYMKAVIFEIVKKASPSSKSIENISKAVQVTVELSSKIYNLVDMAENVSKAEDSNGTLSDLVYMKISQLQKITSDELNGEEFPVFEKYLTYMLSGIPEAQFEMDHDVILTSNADILYLKEAIKLIRDTPAMHLEVFLWWSVIEDLILYSTNSMRQLYNEYLKTITGVEGIASRSSYCTAAVNKLMGFAVSYLVTEENFMEHTKPKVQKMIDNIRQSFNTLVLHTTWMDWETRESTLKKSEKMKSLIGFPEWIMNRTELELHYKGVSFSYRNLKVDYWQ